MKIFNHDKSLYEERCERKLGHPAHEFLLDTESPRWCPGVPMNAREQDPLCRCGCIAGLHTVNVGGERTGCKVHLGCSEFNPGQPEPEGLPVRPCHNQHVVHEPHEWERWINQPGKGMVTLSYRCGGVEDVLVCTCLGGASAICPQHGESTPVRTTKVRCAGAADLLTVDPGETTGTFHVKQGLERLADQPEPNPAWDLANWWRQMAEEELNQLLPKLAEYGGNGAAIDLIEIGRTLVLTQDASRVGVASAHAATDLSDAELAELGCYFYLVGKMARWTAAVAEGRQVSDDTLHDIGVYARMVQRIRAAGGWPNG